MQTEDLAVLAVLEALDGRASNPFVSEGESVGDLEIIDAIQLPSGEQNFLLTVQIEETPGDDLYVGLGPIRVLDLCAHFTTWGELVLSEAA